MAKRITLDGQEIWDGSLPKSIVSDYDLRAIAYRRSHDAPLPSKAATDGE